MFTFFAPLLRREIGVGEDGVALYLLLFGAAAFVGNLVGGYVADHVPARRALMISAGVLMAAFIAVAYAGHLAPHAAMPVVTAAIVVWGLFGWAFLPIQQTRLAAAAPTLVPVALSLNASCIYVGTALGSGVASLVVAHASVIDIGWVSAAWTGLGLLLLLVAGRTPQAAAGGLAISMAEARSAGE
jgi:predicted MFS family arabinose efflux permease